MKRLLILLIITLLALDDITTSSEPSYIGEYCMLAVSGIVFLVIGVVHLRKR